LALIAFRYGKVSGSRLALYVLHFYPILYALR
jgi:hypothetical protein